MLLVVQFNILLYCSNFIVKRFVGQHQQADWFTTSGKHNGTIMLSVYMHHNFFPSHAGLVLSKHRGNCLLPVCNVYIITSSN